MGPWEIVGSLALGATVVLTEGSPLHPASDRLLRQVERHHISVLGVSPTLVRAMRATSTQQGGDHDRSSLRRYDLATAVLAAVFAARFLVLQRLYENNEVGWLTVAKIAMNYPLWAVALVVIVGAVRRADHRRGYCRTPAPA